MQSSADIAILGAGPAAVATGCGLRRLGYDCLLIGSSHNRTVEAMSERTLSLLRQSGLVAAADTLGAPAERLGIWGGEALLGGKEYIVDRANLDAALRRDAASNGVAVCDERAVGYERLGSLWRVRTESEALLCRVLVDARGRRVQRPGCRGPELVAVCQRFALRHAGHSFTRIEALPQGWYWLAVSQGMAWLQVTSSREEPSLRAGLEQHLGSFIGAASQLALALAEATPLGAPVARAATATLSADSQRVGLIRAGDAALALDPLSGQGVYEALRSAHVAVAAADTLLATGSWGPIEQFLGERMRELWQRRNSTAALHYLRQAQSTPTTFWTQFTSHYQAIQPRRESAPRAASVEWRPVLNGTRIETRRVVVTPTSPRGIWQLDSVDLPELMDLLATACSDIELAALRLSRPPEAIARALQWLRAQGLCGTSPAVARGAQADDSPVTARQA